MTEFDHWGELWAVALRFIDERGLIGPAIVLAVIALALLVHWVVFAVLGRLARHSGGALETSLVRCLRRPAWLIFMLVALLLVVPATDPVRVGIQRGLSLLLTMSFGWLAVSLTRAMTDLVITKYDRVAADSFRARELYTRVRFLRRVLTVIIVVITISSMLMVLPSVRHVGVTLFASAGIASIVAGLAARPVLANLLAGLQLALTQPIRIDDVVIVEGEWGWIEEIEATFVVVRVWDLRRLVVPLTYFIETPFQNWTRKDADLLGTAFFYVDYTVPMPQVREALHRILQDAPEWDGKIWGLQVTDTSERTIELRALMGARNSGEAWNLRCYVREKLIEFLQREYPDALPRLRADVTSTDLQPPIGRQEERGA